MNTNDNDKGRQGATLAVVLITAFVTTMASSSLNLAIPQISMAFHAKATLIGWIMTGYMLANATFAVPFGRIADLTGRRRILILGIGIFSISSGLAIISTSIWMLLFFRILQGFGSAMIFATNTAILVHTFPIQKTGKMLGYSVASTYIGLSTGPVIGGFLTHNFGWRSVFILAAAVGLIAFIIALTRLPKESGNKIKGDFDKLGNILYIAMILLLMYGFSTFSSSIYSKLMLPTGILIGILFVRHELRTESPIIEVRIFAHNLSYTLSNLAALLNYGATFAVGYLLSIYLQLIMGYSAETAGTILIIQPLIMAILSPLTGRLSDKIAPYKLASLGMFLCAIALGSYSFLSVNTPIFQIIINLVLVGVGFALFSSPNTNAVMSSVSAKDYGVASSILATMRSMGHTISMATITLILAAKMGASTFAQASPELLASTMSLGFSIFTLVCIVGIFFSLTRRKTSK